MQEKVDIAITGEKLKKGDSFNVNDYKRLSDFTPEIESKYSEYIILENGKICILSEVDQQVRLAAESLGMYVTTGAIASVGSNKVTIEGVQTASIRNYKIYGNSIQNGTPSPTSPVEIQSVGDKTKNLINGNKVERAAHSYSIKIEAGDYIARVYNEDLSTNGITVGATYSVNFLDDTGATIIPYVHKGVTVTEEQASKITTIRFYWSDSYYTGTSEYLMQQLEKGLTATKYEPYGYKIPVTTTGKNLFELKNVVVGLATCTNIENGYYLVPTDKTGGSTEKNEYGRFNTNDVTNKDLYLEAGTYTISYNVKIIEPSTSGITKVGQLIFTSDSKTEVGTIITLKNIDFSSGKIEYEFTLESPKWVTYAVRLNGMSVEITNLQLEKGSNSTEYEPYQETITNIYLSEPLRKIGDYADYIDFVNQKVVRNINAKQLNSTLPWRVDYYPTLLFIMNLEEKANNGKNTDIMSKYATKSYISITNVEGIGLGFKNCDTYWGFETLDDMKKWLDEHKDLVIYYPLAMNKEEKIELPDLPTINGIGTIEVNTLVSPSSIKVDY